MIHIYINNWDGDRQVNSNSRDIIYLFYHIIYSMIHFALLKDVIRLPVLKYINYNYV